MTHLSSKIQVLPSQRAWWRNCRHAVWLATWFFPAVEEAMMAWGGWVSLQKPAIVAGLCEIGFSNQKLRRKKITNFALCKARKGGHSEIMHNGSTRKHLGPLCFSQWMDSPHYLCMHFLQSWSSHWKLQTKAYMWEYLPFRYVMSRCNSMYSLEASLFSQSSEVRNLKRTWSFHFGDTFWERCWRLLVAIASLHN